MAVGPLAPRQLTIVDRVSGSADERLLKQGERRLARLFYQTVRRRPAASRLHEAANNDSAPRQHSFSYLLSIASIRISLPASTIHFSMPLAAKPFDISR